MNNKKKIFTIFLILTLIFFIKKNVLSMPLCAENFEEEKINNVLNNNNNTSKVNTEVSETKEIEIETKNDQKEDNTNERDDIEISADNKIEVDNENGVMIVTGNAFVKEGVTSLQADMLTAFTCETKDGDTKIIQINADNNVIITSDQGKAFAERGIYFVENKMIELYDNVRLEKEGDILVGDLGMFNVLTGKGEISIKPDKEGGRKKVYGIIRSKKK